MTEFDSGERPDTFVAPQTKENPQRPTSVQEARVSPDYFVLTPGHGDRLAHNIPAILDSTTSEPAPAFSLGEGKDRHLTFSIADMGKYLHTHGNDQVVDAPVVSADSFISGLSTADQKMFSNENSALTSAPAKETQVLPYLVGMLREQITQPTGVKLAIKDAIDGDEDPQKAVDTYKAAKGQVDALLGLTDDDSELYDAVDNYNGDEEELDAMMGKLNTSINMREAELAELGMSGATRTFLQENGLIEDE